MQKLHLCHLALAVYPERKDGAAKFARRIYDELKRRGHDITLLTAKWGEGFEDPNIVTINIPRSRFMWVPKYAWAFYRYLQAHEFDIIHSNGSRSSVPILMARKPFVSHIHDVGPFQTSFSPLPFIKMLERMNAQAAKRILTCAEANIPEIHHFMGADPKKMFAVSDAIDPGFHPSPQQADELRERWDIQGPVLCYVGRIEFYKDVDNILKAYRIAKKTVPDLNLVIGGGATLTMKATVEQWKRTYPEVRFVGIVPDAELPGFYSLGDAFVTYSYASEGFGLTLVEAMACGTPVITSNLPAYQEVLKEFGIYVPPREPKLLAQTFANFFQDPDRGRSLVEGARDLIAQYTWENVVDNIERVYENYLQEFGKK